MNDKRFNEAVKTILRHEDKFSNDKNDPGGATMYGISLRFIKAAGIDVDADGDIDVNDILALDKTKAIEIYRKFWWYKYDYESIESLVVATKIFDFAVNMGALQAHKIVQRAVNALLTDIANDIKSKPHQDLSFTQLTIDGILGGKSVGAINQINQAGLSDALISYINKQAIEFYYAIVNKNPDLHVFLKGWLNRVADKIT